MVISTLLYRLPVIFFYGVFRWLETVDAHSGYILRGCRHLPFCSLIAFSYTHFRYNLPILKLYSTLFQYNKTMIVFGGAAQHDYHHERARKFSHVPERTHIPCFLVISR